MISKKSIIQKDIEQVSVAQAMLEAARQAMTRANQSLSEVRRKRDNIAEKKLYYHNWWLHLTQLRNVGFKVTSVDERIIFCAWPEQYCFQTLLSHVVN